MEKLLMSQEKFDHMLRLSDEQQVLAALAIDQRGALKRQVEVILEMIFLSTLKRSSPAT